MSVGWAFKSEVMVKIKGTDHAEGTLPGGMTQGERHGSHAFQCQESPKQRSEPSGHVQGMKTSLEWLEYRGVPVFARGRDESRRCSKR